VEKNKFVDYVELCSELKSDSNLRIFIIELEEFIWKFFVPIRRFFIGPLCRRYFTSINFFIEAFDTKYCGEGSDDGKERRLGRVGGNLMAMEGKFDGKSVKIGIGKVFGLVWSRFEGF
jgi:hypothetical protein